MSDVLIPSIKIMLTKHLTIPIQLKCSRRRSSLVIHLSQNQHPCAIVKSMISKNQSSKYFSLVSKDIEKQERRRQQNRKAAKRLKEKRQLLENDLYKTIQTLQRQYCDLQDYIEQLNERKQYLLYNLNEQSFQEIDKLLSDDNSNFENISSIRFIE